MSSWIVDKACIDLLVEAFFRYEIPTATPVTPDELGTLLWKANYTGVNYRYNRRQRVPAYHHESDRDTFGNFDFYGHATNFGTVKACARDPHMVWKQLVCYEYQSCDSPKWEGSIAHQYVCALGQALLKSTGLTEEDMHKSPQWKSYPWSYRY